MKIIHKFFSANAAIISSAALAACTYSQTVHTENGYPTTPLQADGLYHNPKLHFDAQNLTHKCQNLGGQWGWVPASIDTKIIDNISDVPTSYTLTIFWDFREATQDFKARMYMSKDVPDDRINDINVKLMDEIHDLCAQKNPSKPSTPTGAESQRPKLRPI